MKQFINFAVIGCGNIGSRHASHITKTKEANLVAVCDIRPERTAFMETLYGPLFTSTDYKSILSLPVIDAVSICTPNGLHPQMTIDFLKAGKDVLCEKPLAISIEDARSMVSTASDCNKHLFSVMQNRYNPPVVAVKDLISSGALGQIFYSQANIFWNRTSSYYSQSDWRGTKDLDGGVLYTQASHFLDLLIWFNGQVSDIKLSLTQNFNHPAIDIEDFGTASLVFENGSLGLINFTTLAHGKNMEGSITILGERGSVKIGGEYLNTIDYWNVDSVPPPDLERSAPSNNYGSYTGSMANHDKVIQNVVDVLLGRDSPKVSPSESLLVIKAINNIYDLRRH